MDDSKPQLDPLPTSAFDGETQTIELKTTPCRHFIVRRTATTVHCSRCGVGWIDQGLWVIENGTVTYQRTPDHENDPL